MKKYKLIKDYPACPIKVGDIVKTNAKDSMYAYGSWYFNVEMIESYPEFWQEVKEPLFITEDGKELYDLTERVFGVLPKASWETNHYSGYGIPLEIMDFSVKTPWKYFSTKESAEAWIKENKPEFSRKQVLDVIGKAINNSHSINAAVIFIKEELGL